MSFVTKSFGALHFTIEPSMAVDIEVLLDGTTYKTVDIGTIPTDLTEINVVLYSCPGVSPTFPSGVSDWTAHAYNGSPDTYTADIFPRIKRGCECKDPCVDTPLYRYGLVTEVYTWDGFIDGQEAHFSSWMCTDGSDQTGIMVLQRSEVGSGSGSTTSTTVEELFRRGRMHLRSVLEWVKYFHLDVTSIPRITSRRPSLKKKSSTSKESKPKKKK
jgi:hypothetical protein